jgi:thermostable 8-oxoguanine DNA glycosylase
MKKLYPTLQALLEHRLVREEDPATLVLMNSLHHVRQQGYFTKPEFLAMCKWKDSRELRRQDLHSHSERIIVDVSTQTFATSNETTRMLLLDSLKGVGIPVASAILTLTDPTNYGVIDIRVWQLLHLYEEVKYSPDGTGLGIRHWLDYLPLLRTYANRFRVSARMIELSLFEHHKIIQEGNLYG